MTDAGSYNLSDFLPYLMTQAADQLSLEFQTYYREKYGMLRTEWRVVFHLGSFGDLTAKDICERARTHKTKVSRAVSALAEKGYLTRKVDPNDRRHTVLHLTKAGEAVFIDLRDAAMGFDARLREDISDEDFEVLHRLLLKFAQL